MVPAFDAFADAAVSGGFPGRSLKMNSRASASAWLAATRGLALARSDSASARGELLTSTSGARPHA